MSLHVLSRRDRTSLDPVPHLSSFQTPRRPPRQNTQPEPIQTKPTQTRTQTQQTAKSVKPLWSMDLTSAHHEYSVYFPPLQTPRLYTQLASALVFLSYSFSVFCLFLVFGWWLKTKNKSISVCMSTSLGSWTSILQEKGRVMSTDGSAMTGLTWWGGKKGVTGKSDACGIIDKYQIIILYAICSWFGI
jgi:hypothetical protein